MTGVLERSAQAFSSIGDTLTAQSQSVAQMVEGARSELDGFGSEGTRLIGQRLDVLLGAAEALQGLALHRDDLGRLTTLRRAFHTLKGSGPFTVFAPTDAAFAADLAFHALPRNGLGGRGRRRHEL